jgi:hypothetical protein
MTGFIDTSNINYNQLQQLTIRDCVRLAPFLTGLRASSLPLWLTWFWFTHRSLLQLPLSLVLTLHSWTLNSLTNAEWLNSLTNELSWTELISTRNEYRSPSPTVRVLLCSIRCHRNVFGEPLLINGHVIFVTVPFLTYDGNRNSHTGDHVKHMNFLLKICLFMLWGNHRTVLDYIYLYHSWYYCTEPMFYGYVYT